MSTPAGAERADENRYTVESNRPAARKKPKHTNPKRGLAVLLALFLVLQRHMIKGLTAGAVKG